MREAAGGADPRRMVRRGARDGFPLSEKVYTWWSYRAADWTVGDRGRRLDHIWVSRALEATASADFRITARRPKLGAPVRPRAGDGNVRHRNRNRICAAEVRSLCEASGYAGETGSGCRRCPAMPDRREAARGVRGSTFEHALKQAARYTHHGGTSPAPIAVDGRRMATIRAKLADQRAGPATDLRRRHRRSERRRAGR